jgi:iron complex outermembrane receptor protein
VRTYAKYDRRDDGYPSQTAEDDYHMGRGGFRLDAQPSGTDTFTLEGDGYAGTANERNSPVTLLDGPALDVDHHGANVLSRWSRSLNDTDSLSVQGYWDFYEYQNPSLYERRHTGDLEFQHTFAAGQDQLLVWGLRYRITGDYIGDGPLIKIHDATRVDQLGSVFAQDEISLVPNVLKLTLGSKFDENGYSGFEYQPNVRLSYLPGATQTIWAAVSRAVRTPSRLEDDILVPGILSGSRGADSETLVAYETGYRVQPIDAVSFDIAAFYNDYDHLVTVDRGFVANTMRGNSEGGEISVRWKALENLRLDLTYSYLNLNAVLTSDGVNPAAVPALENGDPGNTATARLLFEPFEGWQLDTDVRYVDSIPALGVSSYTVADIRLAWLPRKDIELAVVGQNLFKPHHFEQSGGTATEVEEGFYVMGTLTF